jgi:hypothetical protein
VLANNTYGWSRHVYDIPFNKFAATLQIAMAAKIAFTVASTCTRVSLILFYYRLVNDSGKQRFRCALHISMAFTVILGVLYVILAIVQCIPVSDYWKLGGSTKCIDEGKATLAVGIINCFADALVTVLPMPMVINVCRFEGFGIGRLTREQLNMPHRQRIAVIILFGLGFIVTIAGAVRTYYIYESLIVSYDETWYAYPLWIAAAVEIDLGVVS